MSKLAQRPTHAIVHSHPLTDGLSFIIADGFRAPLDAARELRDRMLRLRRTGAKVRRIAPKTWIVDGTGDDSGVYRAV